MSDFIYTSKREEKNKLTSIIKGIYQEEEKSNVKEFHGSWGSFAISRNLYKGFEPYETERYICAVIGGPVLYFRDNSFLTGDNDTEGTKAIYNRWINKGQMRWDEDLSGPFVIALVNKKKDQIKVVTDLLSFIPVFKSTGSDKLTVGTHVDTIAKVAKEENDLDLVSIGDFIINGIVTYPYTFYENIKQIHPGTVHSFDKERSHQNKIYWKPDNKNRFDNIDLAATAIRKALLEYIERVTDNMTKVGCFISGGEDSRTILAALPNYLEKHSYIFLDEMNREGKIAKKASEIYGAKFHLGKRSSTYYLDILPEAVDLMGSGFEYVHSHTLGFVDRCDFVDYKAVFGGFLADTFLKGYHINAKRPIRLPFVPVRKREKSFLMDKISVIKQDLFHKIAKRKKNHKDNIEKYSANPDEWFNLWPISMHPDIPYHHCNRRLFKIYEPFMANEVVKISASIPQSWKLNRKVFQKAFKPLLKKSKWLLHGKGTLPYFPWFVNDMLNKTIEFLRKLDFKNKDVYQGNWGNWDELLKSPQMIKMLDEYRDGYSMIKNDLNNLKLEELINSNELSRPQKISIVQVSYFLKIIKY